MRIPKGACLRRTPRLRFLSCQLASVLHYASENHAGSHRPPGYLLRRPHGSWEPRHCSDDAKKQSAGQPSAAAAPIKAVRAARGCCPGT